MDRSPKTSEKSRDLIYTSGKTEITQAMVNTKCGASDEKLCDIQTARNTSVQSVCHTVKHTICIYVLRHVCFPAIVTSETSYPVFSAFVPCCEGYTPLGIPLYNTNSLS